MVALPEDGRLMVEYKGSLIAEAPGSAEKRTVGELWERRRDGTSLFLMAEKMIDGADTRTQILAKVEPRMV